MQWRSGSSVFCPVMLIYYTYHWFTLAVGATVLITDIGWDGVVYVVVLLSLGLVVLCGRGGEEVRTLWVADGFL